ncbi:MAG: glycolate oxidase subunit GlcE [Gammaproteobacteria bacterium]|nr:glycolate oxidase subunit GlcE [Gammaproteobacteria bacterium]
MDADHSAALLASVHEALAQKTSLQITGGGSKSFYGRQPAGKPLSVANHRGILRDEPGELVITARAGTPLAEIEAALGARQQMLAFEPPHFGPGATLGGTIACGLSGPRRPYAGAARDFVLGARIINGRGEILKFGGEVMKNVSGFDAARLMTGALGTLGILLDVSLKVLPRPQHEITLTQACTAQQALEIMTGLARLPLPLSAACFSADTLYLRLSGSESGVRAAQKKIGGEPLSNQEAFWLQVREHTHDFFQGKTLLWRLSLPPAAPLLHLPGQWFIDWGGAQRWLRNPLPADVIRATAVKLGGHAMLFRGGEHTGSVFHPLPPGLLALHKRLKNVFDPQGIFNPGRLYAEF